MIHVFDWSVGLTLFNLNSSVFALRHLWFTH